MKRNGENSSARSLPRIAGCIAGAAQNAIGRIVRAGANSYDRKRDLPALIRLDPFAENAETAEAIAAIVARLERALRAERNRARSGHWTYDLNRHIALRQAHLAETERLCALKAGRTRCRPAS